MRLGSPKATKTAQRLRREMTPPEKLLWQALRRDQLGYRFRRQHPVGPYVLDFFCARAGLCVEVDGEQHDFTVARDARRDHWLAVQGIRTVRIPARDVMRNLEGVVAWIAREVVALPPSPSGGSAATSPW